VKRSLAFVSSVSLIALLVAPHPSIGQDRTPPVSAAQEKTTAGLVPLKIQLVISRTAGEKKISSLPYTLWVTANQRGETNLRMGVQVPVPQRVVPKEGTAVESYSYRDVGTNIDCSAATVSDGWFTVTITLNDSAIQFDSKEAGRQGPAGVAGLPSFRNFTSRFSILLKDGQTAQYTSATDPVSGEVLKVDVTLNVLK
jgi:hypothetical protein